MRRAADGAPGDAPADLPADPSDDLPVPLADYLAEHLPDRSHRWRRVETVELPPDDVPPS
ncbi:hypothetical protein [Kitasatospora phosalacinea]|uniref:hypothetical protein n=1 Tax=Kitasatospora phosalacinea TaxID=2065 RepID=UPI0005273A79|nr:hypothetical protein [Kitasatospora phosalacinea]